MGDRNGRKKMYGIELVLLIGSTLGVVMSSQGYNASMSVFSWLIWWRVMVGIGVGADYPLSAVITAE
jgi:MFS family permease